MGQRLGFYLQLECGLLSVSLFVYKPLHVINARSLFICSAIEIVHIECRFKLHVTVVVLKLN
jgi:hypothetical protein